MVCRQRERPKSAQNARKQGEATANPRQRIRKRSCDDTWHYPASRCSRTSCWREETLDLFKGDEPCPRSEATEAQRVLDTHDVFVRRDCYRYVCFLCLMTFFTSCREPASPWTAWRSWARQSTHRTKSIRFIWCIGGKPNRTRLQRSFPRYPHRARHAARDTGQPPNIVPPRKIRLLHQGAPSF